MTKARTPRIGRKKERKQVASLVLQPTIGAGQRPPVSSLSPNVPSFHLTSVGSNKLGPAAGKLATLYCNASRLLVHLSPSPRLPRYSTLPPVLPGPQGACGGSSSLQTLVPGERRGRPCYVCKLCQFLDCKYTASSSISLVHCSLDV